MYALIILVCICVAIAVYMIFAQIFHLPSFKATRLLKLKKASNKRSLVDDMSATVANKIAKIIPMNSVKEVRYEKALKSAGLEMTSREFIASNIARTVIIFGVPALVLVLINPLAGACVIAVMVFMFFKKKNKIFSMGDTRKEKINEELPKFTKYVINSYNTQSDLKAIVRMYIKNASNNITPLIEELNITLSDMEIFGVEKGVRKFDNRINSQLLSDLCRGLISVTNGENVKEYLESLVRKMQDVWEQNLRTKALKTEGKMMKLVYVIFGVAILTLVIVMGGVLGSIGGSFAAIM